MTESRPMFVLGTSHRVQGSPSFPNSVDDPGYSALLNRIIFEHSIDFIFEEASGCGRTTACRLAESFPSVRYLDVDPHPDLEHLSGIVDGKGNPFPRNISLTQMIEEQIQREELWCKRIVEQDFESGLVICGFQHTLSVAFRLRSAGLGIIYDAYIPHDKLCSHGI